MIDKDMIDKYFPEYDSIKERLKDSLDSDGTINFTKLETELSTLPYKILTQFAPISWEQCRFDFDIKKMEEYAKTIIARKPHPFVPLYDIDTDMNHKIVELRVYFSDKKPNPNGIINRQDYLDMRQPMLDSLVREMAYYTRYGYQPFCKFMFRDNDNWSLFNKHTGAVKIFDNYLDNVNYISSIAVAVAIEKIKTVFPELATTTMMTLPRW